MTFLTQLRLSQSDRATAAYVSPYPTYTKKLQNMTDAGRCWVVFIHATSNSTYNNFIDWNKYPEAIRDILPGEILWTDGNDGYKFGKSP